MTLAVVFFFFFAFLPWEAISVAGARLNSTTRPPPVTQVLKLPLVISERNSSFRSIRGRDLQTSSVRLYDDLVTTGYYSTKVYIGTPPQVFTLIVDTGSVVTYVPCSSCQSCGSHRNPRFQPRVSATYQRIPCTVECEKCNPGRTQCAYDNQYAEKSSSSGVIGKDVLSFESDDSGGGVVGNEVVFGCGNEETGNIYSQDADGILGLGRGKLGVMDQLVRMGVVDDSFSLCYGGIDVGGGAMILGGFAPPPGMIFSSSDPLRSPYYNVDLKKIVVSGVALELDPNVFDGNLGTFMDSGTTLAYLPQQAFVAFRDSVNKELGNPNQIPGSDPSIEEVCFSGYGSEISRLRSSFPQVDLVFGNAQKIPLSPENYLYRHYSVQGAYCLGVLPNGNDKTTLLGEIMFRNTLVSYDRKNSRIGFWKTDCSTLI